METTPTPTCRPPPPSSGALFQGGAPPRPPPSLPRRRGGSDQRMRAQAAVFHFLPRRRRRRRAQLPKLGAGVRRGCMVLGVAAAGEARLHAGAGLQRCGDRRSGWSPSRVVHEARDEGDGGEGG